MTFFEWVADRFDDPLVLAGFCAICAGLLMAFVALVFTREYGKDQPRHKRRRDIIGERIRDTRVLRRHRKADMSGATARLGTYFAGGHSGYHARATQRVRRVEAEGDVQEEGGAYRQCGELPREEKPDGEEGGKHEEEARTLRGWFYVPPTDVYVLLSSSGEVVTSVSAEAWDYSRGSVARDLMVRGLPIIPYDSHLEAPYHEVEP